MKDTPTPTPNYRTAMPWHVVTFENDLTKSGIIEVESETGMNICGAFNGNLANAHLVSAAPELLEVVLELVEWAGGFDEEELGQFSVFAGAKRAVDKATNNCHTYGTPNLNPEP